MVVESDEYLEEKYAKKLEIRRTLGQYTVEVTELTSALLNDPLKNLRDHLLFFIYIDIITC